MTVRNVMDDLAYGPAARAIRCGELPVVEPDDRDAQERRGFRDGADTGRARIGCGQRG